MQTVLQAKDKCGGTEDLQVGMEVPAEPLGDANVSSMPVPEVPGHRDEDRPGAGYRDQNEEVWDIE